MPASRNSGARPSNSTCMFDSLSEKEIGLRPLLLSILYPHRRCSGQTPALGSRKNTMRLGTRQRAAWLLICLVELLPSHPAYALSFWPTESEWITWPEYCQARYLVSAAGSNSSYSGRIPHSVIKSWEARIGPEVWYSLHHYCAGIVILTRAKFATDSRQREFLNRNALAECQYTLARTPNTHPMHAEIASRVGLVYGELNETDQALRSFDLAINSCPECAVGYQSKAMFHRARGQLDEARQTLETGNAATA